MHRSLDNEHAEVTLFGDERVTAFAQGEAADPSRNTDKVLNLVEVLRIAPSAEERRRLVRNILDVIGFDGIGYGRFSRIGQTFHRVQFYRAYAPLEFTRRYFDRRYFEVDPRLRLACEHEWPHVWDLGFLIKGRHVDPTDAHAGQFLEDADSSGVRSGVMFGIAGAGGIEHTTIVSFYSRKPNREWISDSIVGQAYAMGLGLHEFMSSHSSAPEADVVAGTLSERQREILTCVINGLCDTEIAKRLGTTAHNVDYHLRQLRIKYNVQNRAQLAYVVGRLSII